LSQSRTLDVLIVGAGLSGVGAACHLQKRCPDRTFALLEARESMGGTWDLFRYPGIRSDSDMYTLGYAFRPWTGAKSIAEGSSILRYIEDTAREHGVDRKVRYGHRVERARFSSTTHTWSVDVRVVASNELQTYECSFLLMCAGYYDYEAGHAPDFPGMQDYAGQRIHPQHWPEDLDYGQGSALSCEVRQILGRHRPQTRGQASRISGVTPAAISLLLVQLKKKRLGAPARP